MSYNLQTTNRFCFLDDENEENIDVTPAAANNKESGKPAKKAAAGAVVSNPKSSVPRGKSDKAGAVPAKDDRSAPRAQDTKAAAAPSIPFKAPMSIADEKLASRNEGERPARGPRNNQAFMGHQQGQGPTPSNVGNRQQSDAISRPSGKREFERKSGSDKAGVKAHDKREGSGAHNWGNSVKDFTNETLAPEADNDADEEKKGEEKPMEEGEIALKKPEEPVVMSLEDYLKNKPKVQAAVQLRQPGEGDGAFSGKLGRKLPANNVNEDDEEVEVMIKGGSGRVKKKLDVVFGAGGQQRGGGRGGGRGGRGGYNGPRGGGYYGNEPAETIVFDDSAFPSLKAS
jgi:plasminogen activator inhibitor 1 RNA-binding protein